MICTIEVQRQPFFQPLNQTLLQTRWTEMYNTEQPGDQTIDISSEHY